MAKDQQEHDTGGDWATTILAGRRLARLVVGSMTQSGRFGLSQVAAICALSSWFTRSHPKSANGAVISADRTFNVSFRVLGYSVA